MSVLLLRRAIRHRHSAVDEERGGHVVARHIPGTPVYRVKPVTGTKVRTLHRNLLLPLGVKYQPDIDSDESD